MLEGLILRGLRLIGALLGVEVDVFLSGPKIRRGVGYVHLNRKGSLFHKQDGLAHKFGIWLGCDLKLDYY